MSRLKPLDAKSEEEVQFVLSRQLAGKRTAPSNIAIAKRVSAIINRDPELRRQATRSAEAVARRLESDYGMKNQSSTPVQVTTGQQSKETKITPFANQSKRDILQEQIRKPAVYSGGFSQSVTTSAGQQLAFRSYLKSAVEKSQEQQLRGSFVSTKTGEIFTPKQNTQFTQNLKRGDIQGAYANINAQINKYRTAQLRGKLSESDATKLLALSLLKRNIDLTKGTFYDLPKTVYNLSRNPISSIKKARNIDIKILRRNIFEAGAKAGEFIRTSPVETTVLIGNELLFLKGSGATMDFIEKGLFRLSPKYLGSFERGGRIPVNVNGETKYLEVVGRIPKEELRSQVKRAGTEVNAVSSQADALLGLIKRQREIKKPINIKIKKGIHKGEYKSIETLIDKKGLKLLNKYDSGVKLSRKEVSQLNRAIQEAGAKGLLERSFFADPTGKIRPSRLGILPEKPRSFVDKYLDYATGDITFRKAKPQILFFNKAEVERLPSSLSRIRRKLLRNQGLTSSESAKLLEFQLKKSGKFKPIGFISKESELTLPPGEILKRTKKLGNILVDGERVKIVQAEILKPSGQIKRLISKYEGGRISKAEIKNLDKSLKDITGFDYKLRKTPSELYRNKKARYFNIRKIIPSISRYVLSKSKVIKPSQYIKSSGSSSNKKSYSYSPKSPGKSGYSYASKSSSSQSYKKSGSSGKSYSRGSSSKGSYSYSKSSSGGSRYSSSGRLSRVSRIIPRKSVVSYPGNLNKRRMSKSSSEYGFNVYVRPLKKMKKGKIPKLIKVNKFALTKQRAEDLRNYIVDNTLTRTAQIIPTRQAPIGRVKVPIGYAVKTMKKFRTYKIRKGKRIKLPYDRVIEKSKYLLDTKNEKRKISLLKEIARLNKIGKIKRYIIKPRRKRKLSNLQLRALAKGRAKLFRMRMKRNSF